MIVNRLPDILKHQNISIRELSRLTGITYTTVRALYHGERESVKLDVLDAICRVLGVQPGDIYIFAADEAEAAAAAKSWQVEAAASRPEEGTTAVASKTLQRESWKNW